MQLDLFSKIKDGRQDGAVKNGFLFSFNSKGECTVYKTESLGNLNEGEAEVFAEFVLDKNELIVPHSNSVVFGNEYFDEKDEFPLLYSNIYNNYAKMENKLKGVCLVYRLQREEKTFFTTLVQIIEVGFAEDKTLWESAGENEDVRPYGNFVIDCETDTLYAFTMRDNTQTTRYFAFDMPKKSDGEMCEYGVKKVVLTPDDIREYFDCDYHHFVQGACCKEGRIYSLEGFSATSENNPAAIRIVDIKQKKEVFFGRFGDYGANIEPEMIDFENDICYYSDHHGNLYKINFGECKRNGDRGYDKAY